MRGFFSLSHMMVKEQPRATLVPKCGLCGLYKDCASPKMPLAGLGKKKILIVGEAPGATEDQQNKPFVGKAGQLLQSTLTKLGVSLFRDCWVTNSLLCRPYNNVIKDPRAIDYCRPNVIRVVEECKPELIIPLGGSAVRSLLGWLWREDTGPVTRWVGWRIPCRKINAWVCPTYHPSFVKRADKGGGGSGRGDVVKELLFERHLKSALSLKDRPYGADPPDQGLSPDVTLDVARAARVVRAMVNSRVPVAVDYETNMLKPDGPGARIISCAVSDGETALAFPWHGRVKRAVRELLTSRTPVVASNLRFEERWTRKEFGVGVKNWDWDTMVAAHVLDNRPLITSIKFQAFVLLGVDSWDWQVKPFLRQKNPNQENRIREVDLPDLLKYNALDALYEWQVARVQKDQMQWEKDNAGSE